MPLRPTCPYGFPNRTTMTLGAFFQPNTHTHTKSNVNPLTPLFSQSKWRLPIGPSLGGSGQKSWKRLLKGVHFSWVPNGRSGFVLKPWKIGFPCVAIAMWYGACKPSDQFNALSDVVKGDGRGGHATFLDFGLSYLAYQELTKVWG